MTRTPTGESTFSIKIRRSRFTGIMYPVDKSSIVPIILSELRKKHYTASHVCWAYRIHENGQLLENCSDAGEPSGTAGLPILNAMKQEDLINAAVYVIRIYGGQKLGKQGLIDAYGGCASEAIKTGSFKKWVLLEKCWIKAPIEFYGQLMHLIENHNGIILEDRSAVELNWHLSFKDGTMDKIKGELIEISNGKVEIFKE